MASGSISLFPQDSGVQHLVETLRAMAEDGLAANPTLIGEDGDRPQAVLISLEQFHALADNIDAVASMPHIRERLAATDAAGGPAVATLDELAAAVNVDLSDQGDRGNGHVQG